MLGIKYFGVGFLGRKYKRKKIKLQPAIRRTKYQAGNSNFAYGETCPS